MILSKFKTGIICFAMPVLLIAGQACTEKKKITGADYIPRDVFVEVLLDIHLVDGITNDVRYYRKFNPGDSVDINSYIFEKHNVTREQYELTVNEYSKHPELFDKVYDEVIMKLNQMQDEAESNTKAEEERIDIPDRKRPAK